MKMKRRTMNVLGGGLLLAGLLYGIVISTPAQEEDPPAFKEEVAVAESKLTLWELIRAGGLTMFPLGLLSVAMVALTVRNFMELKSQKLLRPDLLPEIQAGLARRDIEGVSQLCADTPCLLTHVLHAGLARVKGDTLDMESVQQAVQQAGRAQMTTRIKPINYLSNIGAVSPMLGLLGTVSGMIKAFQAISTGGMGKPEVLAGHIGEALVTTATGLIIAIPAMLFYFFFKGNFAETMTTLGHYMGGLLDTLRTGEAVTLKEPAFALEAPATAPDQEVGTPED